MDLQKVIERNFTHITDDYREFVIRKDKCRQCGLYEHYKHVGQSEGNAKDPTFMFVGEAAGSDEVEHCRPFIGGAGQRLRSELRKQKDSFRRDSVFITNVLACRPPNNNFPEGNAEVKTCTKSWLLEEIKLLRPKVIITLGNQALRTLRNEHGITNSRGKWKFLPECRAWSFATFHPSYVLRCTRDNKPHVNDLFNRDVKVIATTYTTMCSDYRLHESEAEWKRSRALATATKLGFV